MSAVSSRLRPSSARLRSRPRALVVRAPGTNCDRETVIALELAGAEVESVHFLAASRSATISVRVRSGHTAWRPCVKH